jgi:GT2 family glycosyltransferase
MANRNPTIVVPVYGRIDLTERCLRAIDDLTNVSVPLLLIDDCGDPPLSPEFVRQAIRSGRRTTFVRHTSNQGFVATMNEAFERTGSADVVLVNSDVIVLPGWLPALRLALSAVPDLASASALADRGGILSLPGLAELQGRPADEVARRIGALRAAVHYAALIPVAVGHCTLFNRSALRHVGGFDTAFSPGYGEEVDWSLRAIRLGWHHVAALHSFVFHEEAGSFGANQARERLRRRHELTLAARYPRRFVGIRRFVRNPDTDLNRALNTLATTSGL